MAKKRARKTSRTAAKATAKKSVKKTARKSAKKTVRKAAAKTTKKAVRRTARRPPIPAGPVCNVTPNLGPHTFPAVGGEFFVLVSYPSGPDACPYTATPNVPWIKANPRISEFDVILAPNPRRTMRRGVVVVQGQFNSTRHKVIIQQSGA